MRIVALADIHSNLTALEAVMEQIAPLRPDRVVVAGDLVNRGPQPRECVERILERRDRDGWLVIRGNHEDFVLNERVPDPGRPAYLQEVFQHSTWTCAKLRPCLEELSALPDQLDFLDPDGHTIRVVHGTYHSNRGGLYPKMADNEMRNHAGPATNLLLVGHTHVPFARKLGNDLVVNVGAVGLPFDRDPRAAYAVLDWNGEEWNAELVRTPYDLGRAEQAMSNSGFLDEGGPMVRLILDELRQARPHLRQWQVHYEDAVARGERTIEETVTHRLATAGR